MKKTLALLLALLLCFTCVTPAWSVDRSRAFQFDLLVNDSATPPALKVGDTLTVQLVLQRTDTAAEYALYAAQDEIIYDSRYFSLVAGSVNLDAPNFLAASGRTLSDNQHKMVQFYLGPVEEAGISTPARLVVGSFQLLAILATPTGETTQLSQSNYAVGTQNGQDTYLAEGQNLALTIQAKGGTTDPDPDPDPGPGNGGGGGGGGGGGVPDTTSPTETAAGTTTEPVTQLPEPTVPQAGLTFTDLPPTHWAYDYVAYLVGLGGSYR